MYYKLIKIMETHNTYYHAFDANKLYIIQFVHTLFYLKSKCDTDKIYYQIYQYLVCWQTESVLLSNNLCSRYWAFNVKRIMVEDNKRAITKIFNNNYLLNVHRGFKLYRAVNALKMQVQFRATYNYKLKYFTIQAQ